MNSEFKNIEDLFSDNFNEFKVEPSQKLWAKISQRILFKEFLQFGLLSFNVYYAASVLAISIAGVMYLKSANTNSEIISQDILTQEKTEISLNPDQKTSVSDKISPKEIAKNQEQAQQVVSKNVIENDIQKVQITDNVNNKNIENKTSGEKELTSNSLTKSKTKDQNPKIKDTHSYSSNIKASEENQILVENVFIDKKSSETIEKEISEGQVLDLTVSESEFAYNEIPEKGINEAISSEEIIIYDTIRVYDTLVHYDTIKIKKFYNRETSPWSLGFSISPFVPGSRISENNENALIAANKINDASSGVLSYSIAANVRYINKNFEISTGIGISQIQEDFNYSKTELKIDSGFVYNIFVTDTLILIDTIGYDWEYDSINGYHVLVPVIKETHTHLYDSTKQTYYDSTTNYLNYTNRNKYTYLEIPLNFGYRFEFEDFSLTPKLGFVTGIFLNAKGKSISIADPESIIEIDPDKLPFAKINFDMSIGLGFGYSLNKNTDIYIEPYYRRRLNSIYEDNYDFDHKFDRMGINFGFYYRF